MLFQLLLGKQKKHFKPEICIYDDTEEDDAEVEPPKTESRGVTAKAETETWNSMREKMIMHLQQELTRKSKRSWV